MRQSRIRAFAVAAALLALSASGAGASAYLDDPAADPQWGQETYLTEIGWSEGQVSSTLAPVMIGIADSGLAAASTEFEDQSGESMVTPDSAYCTNGGSHAATSAADVDDALGHGTAIASLAAAPINGRGMVGVSPYSPLVVARFTQDTNDVSLASCAIGWLARQAVGNLLVANLSFGGDSSLLAATNRLVKAQALVVAAVGNRSPDGKIPFPASASHTLAVGDVEDKYRRHGPALDVLAPGDGLVAPRPGDPESFTTVGGTSYATALVSGAAALVWQHYPAATPQQIGWLLRRSADGYGRWTSARGFGEISIARALATTKIPPDDELEPDDSRGTATKHPCLRSGPCSLRGILVSTDDTVDYWRVTGAACPTRRPPSHVLVTCTRSGSAILVTARISGKGLRTYTLTLR